MTFNTANHQQILANETIHKAFIPFCERAHSEFQISVGRYVIMPDHLHLFVSFPEQGDVNLQNWIKSLKAVLGKTLIQLKHPKPHWQQGFFDHVLRSSDSYGEKWQYVSLNPIRAGLCSKPEDWPYQGEILRLTY